jgi:hypothetical protein
MDTGMASGSRLGHWADKLAVEAEPGLTSTQLLVNSPTPNFLHTDSQV